LIRFYFLVKITRGKFSNY